MPFRTTSHRLAWGLALALAGCELESSPAGSELAARPGSDGGIGTIAPADAGDAGSACGLRRPANGWLVTSTGLRIARAQLRTRRDGSLVVHLAASRAPILELRLVARVATEHTLLRVSFPEGSHGDRTWVVPASELAPSCGSELFFRLFGLVQVGSENVDVELRLDGATEVGLLFAPCCLAPDGGSCAFHRPGDDDLDCDDDVDEEVDEGADAGRGCDDHPDGLRGWPGHR